MKLQGKNQRVGLPTAIAASAGRPVVYETENDIAEKNRSELNVLMNHRLASAVDL